MAYDTDSLCIGPICETSWAPSLTNARAQACPIPALAPVMSATFPLSLLVIPFGLIVEDFAESSEVPFSSIIPLSPGGLFYEIVRIR
jgi:hypothetical protein